MDVSTNARRLLTHDCVTAAASTAHLLSAAVLFLWHLGPLLACLLGWRLIVLAYRSPHLPLTQQWLATSHGSKNRYWELEKLMAVVVQLLLYHAIRS